MKTAPFKFIVMIVAMAFSVTSLSEEYLKLTIKTEKGNGDVLIKLLPDIAPKHVERIKTLAKEGFYNNVAFHRVIEGFMAQTGDVQYGNIEKFDISRAGTGASVYPDLPAEFSNKTYAVGVVGMARSRNPNSGNSQFFITTKATPHLDGKYTVFGEVVEGMDVVYQIKLGNSRAGGKVTAPDYIVSATIADDTQVEVKQVSKSITGNVGTKTADVAKK